MTAIRGSGIDRLRHIAHDVMVKRGLLPDFSSAVVAEMATLGPAPMPHDSATRDLRDLPWASIDNDDSRDLDQLSVARPLADGAAQGLCFEFHYFFMRKLWFAHLARALVVFPGGFGTLDELMEILTLMQTHKIDRRIPVLLFGSSYWKEVINFEALVRHAMVDAEHLSLFHWADEPATALALLQQEIAAEWVEATPAVAHSRTPQG